MKGVTSGPPLYTTAAILSSENGPHAPQVLIAFLFGTPHTTQQPTSKLRMLA